MALASLLLGVAVAATPAAATLSRGSVAELRVVGSDESWKAARGPILMSEIYMGETYDARLEHSGWSAPGFDDGAWSSVRTAAPASHALIAPAGPPVRRIEEIRPVAIKKTPGGDTVVDLGQNMVGWVRLKVRGPAGATVKLRHAEVLDKDGNFYTANLRAARQLVTYTLKGGAEEIYEPRFSFQGFRYVAVDGYPGEVTLNSVTGVVVHSDMPVTGQFETSNPLLNQLQRNIVWGQKGNFLYAALLSKIKTAFQKEFVSHSGRVGENTQTAYALALRFDLLPEDLRAEAARRLADEVRTRKHLTTGFVGTPHLCHVLSDTGHLDVAYHLLNRDTYPSWLYPVKQGATTIWERWDGQKPDGTFQDVGMNSFNHYAYGAIGEWMYRVVAGLEIDPSQPGYKHVLIQPRPGGGLTSVEARLETMYGRAASGWKLSGDQLQVSVTVPANTHGTIRLPGARWAAVTEGGRAVAGAPGIGAARQDGAGVVVEVGSGTYAFAYPATNLELPSPSLPATP